MEFYVGSSQSFDAALWKVREDENRVYMAYPNPDHLGFDIPRGSDIGQLLEEKNPEFAIRKSRVEASRYFPRMTRPTIPYSTLSRGGYPGFEKEKFEIASSMIQMDALYSHFLEICRVVQPTEDNKDVFGHEIRNLFILACTEFEAQCKGVLKANGANPKSKNANFNLTDYQSLVDAMQLDGYGVTLTAFPWWGEIEPLRTWKAKKTLEWYQNYNKVKHDREEKFKLATLQSAILAVSACAIMLDAQYLESAWGQFASPSLRRAFSFHRPTWDIADRYILPTVNDGVPMTPTPYPF
ncbi:hypothetical protein HQ945_08245 [Phyllobacterium sp. BT25]|uniref:Uncharacterized protein n=1 Tax=Phyllobacterium pellucidum TaxID=2740464 RepID=A0A849VTQ3_9HYPH|nr:hypothetical protein [Phyllobacterium pellucidum]NTS31243.1 hypothetical protein [Phyllobacterium pellucidum]